MAESIRLSLNKNIIQQKESRFKIYETNMLNILDFYNFVEILYNKNINHYNCHKTDFEKYYGLNSYVRFGYRNFFFTQKAKRSYQCFYLNKILNKMKKNINQDCILFVTLGENHKLTFTKKDEIIIENFKKLCNNFDSKKFENSNNFFIQTLNSLSQKNIDSLTDKELHSIINFIIKEEKSDNFYMKVTLGTFKTMFQTFVKNKFKSQKEGGKQSQKINKRRRKNKKTIKKNFFQI